MRILLTEDDHPLANTMLSMLRDDQNTVDWVDDGQQALNALLNESFDLAILDLTLPRVDGLDIVRQVREQGVELPIIILTARSELTEKTTGTGCRGRRLPDQALCHVRTESPDKGGYSPPLRHTSLRTQGGATRA